MRSGSSKPKLEDLAKGDRARYRLRTYPCFLRKIKSAYLDVLLAVRVGEASMASKAKTAMKQSRNCVVDVFSSKRGNKTYMGCHIKLDQKC